MQFQIDPQIIQPGKIPRFNQNHAAGNTIIIQIFTGNLLILLVRALQTIIKYMEKAWNTSSIACIKYSSTTDCRTTK
jgi:hypothetical protein